MAPENEPIAHTNQANITLDQLGEMQPGLARLMAEVSSRYWILYYAAQNGNWKMAALQSSELAKALKIGVITRPKYKQDLEDFMGGTMRKIDSAISKKDWNAFEEAYNVGVRIANAYHRSWNHEEIVWQLPDEAPKHLKLSSSDS